MSFFARTPPQKIKIKKEEDGFAFGVPLNLQEKKHPPTKRIHVFLKYVSSSVTKNHSGLSYFHGSSLVYLLESYRRQIDCSRANRVVFLGSLACG